MGWVEGLGYKYLGKGVGGTVSLNLMVKSFVFGLEGLVGLVKGSEFEDLGEGGEVVRSRVCGSEFRVEGVWCGV